MSFQPLSLDTYTAEGRRELCSRMLAETQSSALIPGLRSGRRGNATTCLHLSPASRARECSAALFQPPSSLTGIPVRQPTPEHTRAAPSWS